MGDFATGGFSLFTGVTAKNLKNFALTLQRKVLS
jgi:hypothetical protein